jgi:alkylated DNA nucleotide flippase Atl1
MQTREEALQYGLSFPDADIRRMIAESYDLVTDSPSKRIYEAVKKIPEGRVATYGQVAELTGAFAFGGSDAQAKLLEADGIEVINGKVDLEKYGL